MLKNYQRELKQRHYASLEEKEDSVADDDTVIEEPQRHEVVEGVRWPTEVVSDFHTAIDGDN